LYKKSINISGHSGYEPGATGIEDEKRESCTDTRDYVEKEHGPWNEVQDLPAVEVPRNLSVPFVGEGA